MRLDELVAYLDDYLAVREVPDYPNAFNGLQVEGRTEVRRVALAVDACLFTIRAAIDGNADLMLVHHGLLWGDRAPVTGRYYERLALLIKNDLAVYASHLPLDAHPEVGNNHVLARKLGLRAGGMCGEHEGALIGVWADATIPLADLADRVAEAVGARPRLIATGPATTRRVGIVSGGAGTWIDQVQAAGCDTFITGEGPHHTYFEAEERGINVLYAGHYATETVGIRALGEHLAQQFGLETFFIDHPTGL